MSKTLIIAEKPSLGRNIAAAVGPLQKKNGYLENDKYIITWAFGHLFSLVDIESYEGKEPEEKVHWTMDNLPCFPQHFQFELRRDEHKKVDYGVKKQFEIIKSLCVRNDVDIIVNAGDADREGEIIVRLCIQNVGKLENKQFKRLWLPDQTPQTVAKALTEMKDEDDYRLLANEGFARTYIDWLYGVNLTRYATLRSGAFLRVGRVIVPIVQAIYDRDMSIKNFVPGKYFAIEGKSGDIELVSKNKFEEKQAKEALRLCDHYNAGTTVVKSVKKKEDTLFAGKLYSLSKLQNVLGKKYKMSMAESLSIIQKLYEEGYLTYPRTNSEYLATAEQDKVRQILSNCAKLGYPVTFKNSKSIFDDSKIESHSALTPTYKIPDKNKLSEKEMQVYSTVFRRFVAVFCSKPAIVAKTDIVITVTGDDLKTEDFNLHGMVMLEKGWTQFDDYNQKDKIFPNLEEGQILKITYHPEAKETQPPKHYTIETLNNYLKNPFKEEKAAVADLEDDDAEEYRAVFEGLELGTEATRTGIIDNARKSRYIDLKKDVYTILPDGEFLINSLSKMKINMDKYKTSEMGKALKAVFHGKMTVEESVNLATNEIKTIFDDSKDQEIDIGFMGEEVGICPLCHQTVKRSKGMYGCAGYRDGCTFKVGTYICGRAITPAHVAAICQNGKTDTIDGFLSKNGKRFSAALLLKDGKVIFDFMQNSVNASPQSKIEVKEKARKKEKK